MAQLLAAATASVIVCRVVMQRQSARGREEGNSITQIHPDLQLWFKMAILAQEH